MNSIQLVRRIGNYINNLIVVGYDMHDLGTRSVHWMERRRLYYYHVEVTHDDTICIEVLSNNMSEYNIDWSNHIANFMRVADRYHQVHSNLVVIMVVLKCSCDRKLKRD